MVYLQVLKSVAKENTDLNLYVVDMVESQHMSILFLGWGSTQKWR